MKRKLLSILMIVSMMFALLPANVFASQSIGSVRVIVENTTWSKADGAPWDGTLVDTKVNLTEGSTMMTCIVDALDSVGAEQEGAEFNYISYIHGIEQMDASDQSGWMGTLNDWFTNMGFQGFSVKGGTLRDGDIIRVMHTTNGLGADLGGDFSIKDNSLKALSVSNGTFDKEFKADEYEYTLNVDSDIDKINIIPTALTKNYQVKIFSNGKEYRSQDEIPIQDGTSIDVVCGDPKWPTVVYPKNRPKTAKKYNIIINKKEPTAEPEKYLTNISFQKSDLDEIELYKYENKKQSGENLLDSVTKQADGYSLELPAGEYLLKGSYFKSDNSKIDLGEISLKVSDDAENDFEVKAITDVRATNSELKIEKDYNLEASLRDDAGYNRYVKAGKSETSYNLMAISGDTLNCKFIPTAENLQKGYKEGAKTEAISYSQSGFGFALQREITMNFTVPDGATVDMGTLNKYYVFNFIEGSKIATNKYSFKLEAGKTYFYRIKSENGVTLWDYVSSDNKDIVISSEDIFEKNTDFNKKTVFKNFENNPHDLGNIYLNINSKGHLNLNQGESYQLNSFRSWFVIEGIMNSKVSLPDINYKVIDFNGNSSEVVSVIADSKNSNKATLTANKKGNAIVLVTYDSLIAKSAMTGSDSLESKKFSASWPEFTGVFVVTVGEKDNTQAPKINLVDGSEREIDAEHDILHYVGSDGASLSFKPEKGTSVMINRSVIRKEMNFGGFTTEGVIENKDGTVTINNLKSGRHIIKLTKDGKTTYQVVTAKETIYKITDSEGREINESNRANPGETISIQFSGLVNPAEKLSGVYNFNMSLAYKGEDGSKFQTNGGYFGVYTFNSDEKLQKINISLPKYWNERTYKLSGSLLKGGFGSPIGAHRGITYDNGTNPNFNASQVGAYLGSLPDLTIPMAKNKDLREIRIKATDESSVVTLDKSNIKISDSQENNILLNEGGEIYVTNGNYNYEVFKKGYLYTKGSFEVSDDTESINIELKKSDENGWDGITKSEPKKEDDRYLILNGDELAWIADYVNDGANKVKNIKLDLKDDIELAGYPIEPINNNGNTVEFDFEGNGHKIIGLNSYKGLIGTAGGSSHVRNLQVEGVIKAGDNNAGGIVGYLQSGKINNCISNVKITSMAENGGYIGGIVGYAYDGAEIINCGFNGEIDVKGDQVGGILGTAVSSKVKIKGCYNKGNISGNGDIGGIVGKDEITFGNAGITIEDCYNKGNVSGISNVGGILGIGKETKLNNIYNSGKVNGGNPIIGANKDVKADNIYYTNTSVNGSIGTFISREDLTKKEISEAFNLFLIHNDLPYLSWENMEDKNIYAENGTSIIVKDGFKTAIKALDEVPLNLTEKYSDVEKIKSSLYDKLPELESGKYDSFLMEGNLFKKDENGKWNKAKTTELNKDGKIIVNVPYPKGINNKDKYEFIVAHMISEDIGNYKAGDIEIVKAYKSEEGISFELNGFSPILIAWYESPITEPEENENVNPIGNESDIENNNYNRPDIDNTGNAYKSNEKTNEANTDNDSVKNKVTTADANGNVFVWTLIAISFGAIISLLFLKNRREL